MTPKEYPILYSTPMIQAVLNGTKNQTRRIMNPQPLTIATSKLCLIVENSDKRPSQWFTFDIKTDAKILAQHWIQSRPYYPDSSEIKTLTRLAKQNAKPKHKWERNEVEKYLCPYGQVGDFTWARETFVWDSISSQYLYRADNRCDLPYQNKWKSPLFMPREACRIVRENVDIRVERVADISEQGAIAEGIESMIGFGGFTYWKDYEFKPKGELQSAGFRSPIRSYKSLWNSINNIPRLNKKLDSYIVYPFDEQSGAKWGDTYRNKPLIVIANPWVWVIESKK